MKLSGILLAVLAKLLVPRRLAALKFEIKGIDGRQAKRSITASMIAALVAGEDRRFYRHRGIDPIGVMRVMYNFLTRGQLSGASTIEQQLVRALTGDRERSLRRKIREILLASYISRNYPKSDIAEMYLSIAYFGWRMNGVKEACNRLYIDLANLTTRQAASLIARLKYPQPCHLSAERHARIINRTEYILRRLSETGGWQAEVSSNAPIFDLRQM